jgi:hypothetical protein
VQWAPFFSRYVIGEGASSCTDSCADPDCVITCQEPASFSIAFQPPRNSQLLLHRALRDLHGPTGLRRPRLAAVSFSPHHSRSQQLALSCRQTKPLFLLALCQNSGRPNHFTVQGLVWSAAEAAKPYHSDSGPQPCNRSRLPVQNMCNVHIPSTRWTRSPGEAAQDHGATHGANCQLPRQSPNLPADVWHCPSRRYLQSYTHLDFGGEDMQHFGCCRFLYYT